MKKFLFSVLLLYGGLLMLHAQQRDLDFYLEQAMENSPLIHQAKNDSRIILLDLEQMKRILFKPEINVISGFTLSPIISRDQTTKFNLVSEGAVNYIGHDLALTDGGQYQAMLSFRQPLLTGSKYKVFANKADISGKIIDNNIALTIHELRQVVSYQYLLCLNSLKESENTLSLIRKLEEQYRVMVKLVENAVYKQTDLMLMQIELDNYTLEYKTYRAGYAANLYDLNLICGISDTAIVELRDTDIAMRPEIAGKSAFLTGFILDSLTILAEQAVNELKYKPQLDFVTDAGLNATYLPYPKRLGLGFGLALTWNIFDGHQRDIQRQKSAIGLETLEYRKNNFMLQNQINKNKILNQLHSVTERISLKENQAEQYKRLYEAYVKELSLGEASVMDFKNLMKDISALNHELLQLKTEKQFLINSYNYFNY